MEHNFDWNGFFICLCALFGGMVLGISWNNKTTEQVLEKVCIETNGKYDFCVKVDQPAKYTIDLTSMKK